MTGLTIFSLTAKPSGNRDGNARVGLNCNMRQAIVERTAFKRLGTPMEVPRAPSCWSLEEMQLNYRVDHRCHRRREDYVKSFMKTDYDT